MKGKNEAHNGVFDKKCPWMKGFVTFDKSGLNPDVIICLEKSTINQPGSTTFTSNDKIYTIP